MTSSRSLSLFNRSLVAGVRVMSLMVMPLTTVFVYRQLQYHIVQWYTTLGGGVRYCSGWPFISTEWSGQPHEIVEIFAAHRLANGAFLLLAVIVPFATSWAWRKRAGCCSRKPLIVAFLVSITAGCVLAKIASGVFLLGPAFPLHLRLCAPVVIMHAMFCLTLLIALLVQRGLPKGAQQ